MQDVLEPGETLLWSGRPEYGRKLFQFTKVERDFAKIAAVGTIAMWVTLVLIPSQAMVPASWLYLFVTASFAAALGYLAVGRSSVLSNFLYFVTDKRAIICRRGSNLYFAKRLYVVSCVHDRANPYAAVESRPMTSLQVGIVPLSDQLHPFGLVLRHPGQPLLTGRVSTPVMFEYVEDAGGVLEIICSCLPEEVMPDEGKVR